MKVLKGLISIFSILLLFLPTFTFAEDSYAENATEETNNITFGEDLTNDKTIIFPKAKINVNDISYEESYDSSHASDGFIFAKINMDVWIEEEPKNKVNWSALDFVSKWVLNDGREISGGSFTTGSSTLVEAGKWKNVTVALSIRDFQKISSIYVEDPLDYRNTVKVQISESDDELIELKSTPRSNSIELTWNSRSEAELYQLYRSEVERGTFYPIAIITTSDTIYIDTGIKPNIPYWYKVSALKDNIEIQHSNIVNAILRQKNNGGSSSSGGGGGGSSYNPLLGSKDISASSGGSVESSGATVDVPANALTSSFKVTVKKVVNTSNLATDENRKIVSDVYEITKDKVGNFDKSVTVTLPFDKSKYDAKNYEISIFWFNEENKKWIELENVEVDLNNGKVSGEVNHFTKFAILATEKVEQIQETPKLDEDKKEIELEKSVQFSDINGHWAEKEINQLVSEGFINGYPDHTFRPNEKITRAEFTSILVKVLNLEEVDGKIFMDTQNHWAQRTIATAQFHGIINGYNETTFGVNDPITREQMSAMIVKAFKLKYHKPLKTFKDEPKISKWAVEAMETAIAEGIIGGYEDGTINPQGNATRGEAATIIVRSLNR